MTDEKKPGNLRVLQAKPPEPEAPKVNPNVVEMLEHLLDLAKAGEISGVVVVTRINQTYGHDFAGINSIPELLGFNTMCDIVKLHLLDIISLNAES